LTFPVHQLEGPIVTNNSSSAQQQNQPPPIGGPELRSIDDRLGEALRRIRYGLMRPLWADMTESEREYWRTTAAGLRETTLKDVGLKVEIEG
jgi:hypothetical protein